MPGWAGGKVGPFGYRRPLARNNHPALVESAGGAVYHLLQQHGHRHHRIHRHRPTGDTAPYHQAVAPDEGDDGSPAANAGNSGAILPRPPAGLPGNHEDVPGGRGEPSGLPWPAGNPDAHPVRPVPGADPDTVLPPRPPGGAVGKVLRLDSVLSHLYRRAAGRYLLLDGPVRAGPHQSGHAGAGLRFHLAPAENDHDPVHGPPSVHQSDDDAVADAADDSLLLL